MAAVASPTSSFFASVSRRCRYDSPSRVCRYLTGKLGNRSFKAYVTWRSSPLRESTMEDLRMAIKQPISVVLYHYPCSDGVFAALVAYLYHNAVARPVSFLPNTVYEPLRVEDLPTEGVDVFYLLDFSGPKGFAVELAKKAKQVVVLDHHKTALETLPPNGEGPPNLSIVLDMKRSGATISYCYFLQSLRQQGRGFHLNLVDDEEVHRVETLFKYIEDADLWSWVLPDSKAFSSGLSDSRIEYSVEKNPAVFKQLLELDPGVLVEKGKESLAKRQTLIDQALANTFVVLLGKGRFGRCLGVRGDAISNLRSELGNQLAVRSRAQGLQPIGAVVYIEEALKDVGLFKISLRSIGEADTTEISEAFGGGGHRNASSFLMSTYEFELWKE